MGASVIPLRGSEDIMWTIKFRNGMVKRFKFPIRTTPEGTADPWAIMGSKKDDFDGEYLYSEPESLLLDELPSK